MDHRKSEERKTSIEALVWIGLLTRSVCLLNDRAHKPSLSLRCSRMSCFAHELKTNQ